jgi:tetratricopeptide (TPR) repeat protein
MVPFLSLLCLVSGLGDWYSHYSAGEWQAAREEAASMADEDPGSAAALAALSLSGSDDQSGEDSSLTLARSALEADSTLALAWTALGMASLETDRIQAVGALTRALEMDSTQAIAWEGLGIAMLETGEYSLAVNNMQRSVEADSSYMPGWLGHARVLDESGDSEGALIVVDMALERWPESLALLYQKAWIEEWLFPTDSALATYAGILAIDPKSTDAMKYSGMLYEGLDQWGRAIKSYRSILGVDSTYSWACGELGYCYEQLGWYDFAEEWYLKGLDMDPSYAWAAYRMGLLRRNSDLYEALDWFDRATAINPSMADAWVEKGLAYEDTGDFATAASCLRRALEIDPGDYWSWGELGYVLEELGRYDEAAEAYERGVDVNGGYMWGWQQRGLLYEDDGMDEEAIAWYRRAVEESGGSSWLLGELGALLESVGERDSAAACFEEAVEMDSSYTFGYQRLAHIRRVQHRTDETLALLDLYLSCGGDTVTALTERILALEGAGMEYEADSIEQAMLGAYTGAWLDAAWNSYYIHDEDESEALCRRFEAGESTDVDDWTSAGDLYSCIGLGDDSDRCYAEAVSLDPGSAAPWISWGSTLSSSDRFGEAVEKLEVATSMDSMSVEAWAVLGEALLFDRQYDRAEEALEKVLEIDAESAYAICYIGLIRERSGKPLEALEYYLDALALSPGYDYAEDRIRAITDPSYDADWWARDEGMFDASIWLDLSETRGNTEERLLSAGASLTMNYDSRGSTVTLEGSGELEDRWDREVKNTAWASLELNYYMTDELYAEASSSWDRQPLTVRPWQISSYLACGYRRWISDCLWVAPEIGAGLVSSSWSLDSQRTDDVTAYGSFGIWFEKTDSWLPDVWLAGSVYLPPEDVNDLVAYGDAEVTMGAWKPLSLVLGYSVDYTRRPVVSEWEKYDTEVYTRVRLDLF